jgi:hypothetical protein
MSRRDWWTENEWRLGPITRHELDEDPLQAAWQDRIRNPKRPRQAPSSFNLGELMRLSKEMIYCHDDNNAPAFQYITFGLDFGSAEMTVGKSFITVDSDEEDILNTIGLAHMYHVPVVPDSVELEPELRAYERQVFSRGFPVKDGDETKWLIHARYSRVDLDQPEVVQMLSGAEPIMPSEVRVVMETVRRELERHTEAARMLAALRFALSELEEALAAGSGNEGALQRALTRNPVLFGADYSRVQPKFRLGGDYEMDFALVRSSGLVDLVEIEASTHRLFNKRGDAASPLVHAEQQVLDWQSWLDAHGPLARRDLPELQRPLGYVVIGRDESLSSADQKRLSQRNAVFGDALQILTYDGLAARARILLSHLEGLAAQIFDSD